MLQTWSHTVENVLAQFINRKNKSKRLSDICWENITPDLESNVAYNLEGARFPANAAWKREKALIQKEEDEDPWNLSAESVKKESHALRQCIHTLLFHDAITLAADAGIDLSEETLFDTYFPTIRNTKKVLPRRPSCPEPKRHCPRRLAVSGLRTS